MKKSFVKEILSAAMEKVYLKNLKNSHYAALHHKHNKLFEIIKKHLNPVDKVLLDELYETVLEMRTITEEAAYIEGLANSKELAELIRINSRDNFSHNR